MRKAIRILGLLVRIAAFLLLSILAVTAYQCRPWIIETVKRGAATVDRAGRAAQHLDDAAAVWKDASSEERDYLKETLPALTRQTQGILGNASSLLLSLKSTSDGINTSQGQITQRVNANLDETQKATQDARKFIQQATIDLQQFQPAIVQVTQLISDSDKAVNSPEMTQARQHFLKTLEHIDGTTGDIQHAVHSYVYPKPIAQAIDWAIKIGNLAGTWFGRVF